jgi:microcystin-dependent protein
MATPFVGQIISAGFNFAPVGWFFCDGSLKPINQYDVLYNLIGTTYGGDGVNTFAVPDLRGRVPLCIGQGAGQPAYVLGERSGSESVTLLANQVGAHNHALMASANTGTSNTPSSTMALAGNSLTQIPTYLPGSPAPTLTALASNAIGPSTGGGVPHDNLQPLLCLNYIIAWAGIYPSQG